VQLCAQDRNDGVPPVLNIGTGKDLSITELASKIADTVGFSGAISYDHLRPDGSPKKLLDITRITRLGWHADTELDKGLRKAFSDFNEHFGRRM